MADIARIVVISAVFYLVRFAFAHQQQTQSKYSDSDSTYSLQEDNISGYEDSNEKVLIRSGLPLRGRTIHQTAWSEEEKVSVPEKGTLHQPDDQDTKEKLYDSWSFTNAINYILSFIYNTEETDTNANISNNLAGNSNENVNIPKKNLDERSYHHTALKILDPKEISENIPTLNENSVSEASPNYPIENLQNEDIKQFRNDISSLGDEYIYTESDSQNSEFSNESTDSEDEEESYENEDCDLFNYDNLYLMHSLGSVYDDTNGYFMENKMAKPLNEVIENEPQLVSVANSQESDQESDKNSRNKYQEDDTHPAGNSKPDFDQNSIGNYNGNDKNRLQNTNGHPKQQSKSETMKGTGSFSQRTNSPKESPSVEDIYTENSMQEDKKRGNINFDENDSENIHATERTSNENLITEAPPTTPYLQNQRQSQNKEPSPNSEFPTQTQTPQLPIDRNKLGKKYDVNHMPANTEILDELQHEKVSKNPNYVAKTTVKYADRTQANRQLKNSSNNDKKDMDNKRSAMRQNETAETHIKPSGLPRKKQFKDHEQEHLKLKQRYLDDIYFDLEPDDDVRSYNYLLDSYEFIRIGNNNNKDKNKRDSSIYVVIQDKEHNSSKEGFSTLSTPLTPFKDQTEVEVIDKSHESFDTILEYLYKNSNSSFLLSLKEYNSSGI